MTRSLQSLVSALRARFAHAVALLRFAWSLRVIVVADEQASADLYAVREARRLFRLAAQEERDMAAVTAYFARYSAPSDALTIAPRSSARGAHTFASAALRTQAVAILAAAIAASGGV